MAELNPASAKAFTLVFRRVVSEVITSVGVVGPFIPDQPPSEVLPMKALWDTGATHCCITKQAAERAKLPAIGRAIVTGVHGAQERDEYYMNLILPNQVMVSRIRATECDEDQGKFDVIIGMSVITLGDFAISQPRDETVFTFRIPSIESIDFVEQAEAYSVQSLKKMTPPQ